MTKKYKINADGRVVALRDFGDVKVGDVGGFLESETNLAHEGDCWVYGDAQVSGNAQVFGNAQIYGNAQVSGNAQVFGNAQIYGNAQVSGNAGNAWVYGITRSDGFSFCYVSCDDGKHRVIAGCRYFTMPEAREHWGADHPKHKETCVILDALESLSKIRAEGCV